MSFKDDRPVIIVKKKVGHEASHGGAWKVAYADFVTAMMAFFLVMWILGLNQDTRKAIAAYFQDPVGFLKTFGGGTRSSGIGHDRTIVAAPVRSANRSIMNSGAEEKRLQEIKRKLEKEVSEKPEFKKIRNLIEFKIDSEGLHIELLESRNPIFFDLGSARLLPQTEHLLHLIGPVLAGLPNNIAIEGHTDARPFSGGPTGYTNWELSSDRANAARRCIDPYLRQKQVNRVAGWADTHLRVPSDPYHYSNRRISILVEAMGSAFPNIGIDSTELQSKFNPNVRPTPVTIGPSGR